MILQKIDGLFYGVSTTAYQNEPKRVTSGWKVTWSDGPLDAGEPNAMLHRFVDAYQVCCPSYRTVTINVEKYPSYSVEESIPRPRGKEVRYHNGGWQRYSRAKGWQYV